MPLIYVSALRINWLQVGNHPFLLVGDLESSNFASINDMIASPSEMFSYRLGEARRKFVILFVLVLLFFLTLIAFHRQDTIKQVVAAERGPLSETTLVSGLKPLPAKSLKDVRNSTLGVSISHGVFFVPN